MNFRVVILLWFFSFAKAQDASCNFVLNVQPNQVYSVNSPNYPNNYTAGVSCLWRATCPSNFNCQLNCTDVNLPDAESCTMDRLLISRTGDPQLTGADTYCGKRTINVVSSGQTISIGLTTSRNSPGGRFYCELRAQLAIPDKTCSCGVRRQNRIVGGEEPGVNEYNMMAGLVDLRSNQITCGGAIISARYVLTAANCVQTQTPQNYAVLVGEHDLTTREESPATQIKRVIQILIHPLYSESNYDYDVAIVLTNTEIVFTERVVPVCLPFKYLNTDFTGEKVTVLGWGNSTVLRKVDLDVISQNACRTQVPSLTARQMCTFTEGKAACQGDFGGPALFTDPTTGLLFNIGIVSYGRSCASSEPGVNTRVTMLLNWITANTADANYCRK